MSQWLVVCTKSDSESKNRQADDIHN